MNGKTLKNYVRVDLTGPHGDQYYMEKYERAAHQAAQDGYLADEQDWMSLCYAETGINPWDLAEEYARRHHLRYDGGAYRSLTGTQYTMQDVARYAVNYSIHPIDEKNRMHYWRTLFTTPLMKLGD